MSIIPCQDNPLLCVPGVTTSFFAGVNRVQARRSWQRSSPDRIPFAAGGTPVTQPESAELDSNIAKALRSLASAVPADESQHLQQLICYCNMALRYLCVQLMTVGASIYDVHPVRGMHDDILCHIKWDFDDYALPTVRAMVLEFASCKVCLCVDQRLWYCRCTRTCSPSVQRSYDWPR